MAGKVARSVYRSARWAFTRRQVFDRDKWRCRSCGLTGGLECDHILPIDLGGDAFDLDNLQALCRGCHVSKTARERRQKHETPERAEWLDFLKENQHAPV